MRPSKKQVLKEKAQSQEKFNRYHVLALFAIGFLTFLIYKNSLSNDVIHFDDTEYFLAYPEITHLSWHSIRLFFSSYYLIMYQPLPVLTFALNYQFAGVDPIPLHLVNLCFHLVNILLVFHFASLLLKDKYLALIPALIFGIHPMSVEAVSWISARSSGMYTLFYLLSLIFYLNYIFRGLKIRYLILALLFFLLSLLSKSQAVTLPLVLILIDLFYQRRITDRRVILEKIPFILLSILFAWIAISSPATKEIMSKGMIANYSLTDDFFMLCYSLEFYLVKFLVPVSLCAAYVYPAKSGSFLPLVYYLAPLVLVFTGFLCYYLRKNKYVLFGAALFLLTIFINLQIIPSRLVIVADRYTYFPYLGLLILIVSMVNHIKKEHPVSFRKYNLMVWGVLLFYILFFSVSTVNRNYTWNNDYVFMSDIINKNPEVPYLYRAYGTRANWLKNQNRLDEALQDYTKAVELKPDNPLPYVNRAILNIERKSFRDVIKDADQAVKLNYRNPYIFQVRALAKYYGSDFQGALADCDKSLRLDSTRNEVYDLRDIVLDSLKVHGK